MRVFIGCFTASLLCGCTFVTNGDEIRESLDRCEKIFKEECSMVPLPGSAEPKVRAILGGILGEQ